MSGAVKARQRGQGMRSSLVITSQRSNTPAAPLSFLFSFCFIHFVLLSFIPFVSFTSLNSPHSFIPSLLSLPPRLPASFPLTSCTHLIPLTSTRRHCPPLTPSPLPSSIRILVPSHKTPPLVLCNFSPSLSSLYSPSCPISLPTFHILFLSP